MRPRRCISTGFFKNDTSSAIWSAYVLWYTSDVSCFGTIYWWDFICRVATVVWWMYKRTITSFSPFSCTSMSDVVIADGVFRKPVLYFDIRITSVDLSTMLFSVIVTFDFFSLMYSRRNINNYKYTNEFGIRELVWNKWDDSIPPHNHSISLFVANIHPNYNFDFVAPPSVARISL